MKVNIAPEIDNEIGELVSKLIRYPHTEHVDDSYVEIEYPLLENPLGLAFYPELLTYRGEGRRSEEVTVPWICIMIELENVTEKITREVLKDLVEKFKRIGYTPFHDEDAFAGYFSYDQRKGWAKYKMYVNPDYPQGMWENHTL